MNNEKVSDIELAMFLSGHINEPCGVQVGNKYENIREFYIRLANDEIPKMEDKIAIDYLQKTIAQYKDTKLL